MTLTFSKLVDNRKKLTRLRPSWQLYFTMDNVKINPEVKERNELCLYIFSYFIL